MLRFPTNFARLAFASASLLIASAIPASAASFSYNNNAVADPTISEALTPCTSPLAVTFNVTDSITLVGVSVGINLTHTYRADLRARLFSPAGTGVYILFDNGASFDDIDATFTDSASESTASGTHDVAAPLYDRIQLPAASLATFAGENSAGTWTLEICDTFDEDNGVFGSAQLNIDDTVLTDADLSVSLSASDTAPAFADTLTLTYTVSNASPDAAGGVTVDLEFPGANTQAANEWVVQPGSDGTLSPLTGVWSVGAVPANGSATLVLTLPAQPAGALSYSADLSASNNPDPDSTPDNRVTSEDDYDVVNIVVAPPPDVDLSLAMSVSDTTPSYNDTLTFDYVVTNSSPDAAAGVVVQLNYPATNIHSYHNIITQSISAGTLSTNGRWNIGAIPAFGTATLSLTLPAKAGTGSFRANISEATFHDPDSTPGNFVASEDDDDSVSVTTSPAFGHVPAGGRNICYKDFSELALDGEPNTWAKLSNPAYFGSGGSVAPEELAHTGFWNITSALLTSFDCDIWLGGGSPNESAGETTEIYTWHGAGSRYVIGACDYTFNSICTSLRSNTDIANGGVSIGGALAYNPLGCGGTLSVNTFGGASTYFTPAAGDVILATHDPGGEPAAITDAVNGGTFLFLPDADMLGESGFSAIGAGATATTDQAKLVLNSFKLALDEIAGRTVNACVPDYNNPPGTISGFVYADANGDDAYQSGTETPLANIQVSLYGDPGTPGDTSDDLFFGSVDTDGTGAYSFSVSQDNVYRIEVDAGDTDLGSLTIGTTNPLNSVPVVSGGTTANQNFGFDGGAPSGVSIPLLTCTSDARLFSTGYDGAGGKFVDGDRDTHWEVGTGDASGPGSVTSYTPGYVGNAEPMFWAASPFDNAEWITQTADGSHAGEVDFFYRYRFDLDPAVDVSSFSIDLDFYADNTIHEIYVNNIPQSASITGVPQDTSNPYYFAGFTNANRAQTSLDNDFVIGRNEIVVQIKSAAFAAGFLAQSVSAGLCSTDYSDAPVSYGAPGHRIVPGLHLGASAPDADLAAQPGANADGDDNSFTADEDGVIFPTLTQGFSAVLPVTVTQASASEGYLQGWIDWNGNGDFADPGEQIAVDLQSAAAGTSTINVGVNVPSNATGSASFARFRWSTTSGLDSTTAATDGEVEDYRVTINSHSVGSVGLGSCSTGTAPWTVEWIDRAASNYAPAPGGETPQVATSTPKLAGAWADAPSGSSWITYNFLGEDNGLGNHADADYDDNLNEGAAVNPVPVGTSDFVALRYRLNVSLTDPTGVVLEGLGSVDNSVYSITVNGTANTPTFGNLTSLQPVSLSSGWVSGNNEVIIDVASGPDLVGMLLGDCVITRRDYSDAVADGSAAPGGVGTTSYGTATHELVDGVRLGATVTAELSAVENADNATDDGVALGGLSIGQTSVVTVSTVGSGVLNAWIDFDGSGAFDDPVEHIAQDLVDADGDNTIAFNVTVPTWATPNQTYARFRWSSDFAIGPDGPASDGEVEDYAVTLGASGGILSGLVFLDTGAGGGTAYDGGQSGTEAGGRFATLSIIETAGGTEIATATVGPNGSWSATLPQGFSGDIAITAAPDGGYLAVSEATGALPGLVNTSTTDSSFTFTAAANTPYAGLNFGLVPLPLLSQNQSVALVPGQVVNIAHRYEATATGTVTFAITDYVQNPDGAFASTLFRDLGCDSVPDSVLTAPVAVSAGESVCVVIRTQVSGGVSGSAQLSYGLTADTLFTPGVSHALRNDDVIGSGSTEQLVLKKFVTNTSAAVPVEGTSNSGSIGDVLEYRLELLNPGAQPALNVTVSDQTPAFTALANPIAPSVTVVPGITCELDVPGASGNIAGYTGPLEWSCPGSFPQGETGSLTFRVQISP